MEHLPCFHVFLLGFSFLWINFYDFKDLARTKFFTMFFQIFSLCCFHKKENQVFFNVCTVHLYIVYIENLCDLAKYKFLKLREDDTEVSKHVGVNII